MKTLLRTLAILASLYLTVQTVRHAYVLWFEPRSSVLDKFDRPLKDEIAAAASVDDLLRKYEPVRKEADRIRAERHAADPRAQFMDEVDTEPFKSEVALKAAITDWEQRARELHALRFYWGVGVLLAALGLACYLRRQRWLGVTLLIVAFTELIYWTSPTFFGGGMQEFDRLVANKLALSAVSLALLGILIRVLEVFAEERKPLA